MAAELAKRARLAAAPKGAEELYLWRALLRLAQGRENDARESWRRGAAILREILDTRALAKLARGAREACEKAGAAPFEDMPV